jgi:CreA protein
MKRQQLLILFLGISGLLCNAHAEKIGSVDTEFKLLGPDHKIVIEAFDDPLVEGVACHVSRSEKGGIKGALGLAEETSDASISCRQIGPIRFTERLKDGEQVFNKRRSLLFKTLQVVRFYDPKRNTLVYLSYSDKLVAGSPQSSISTVPIMPWPTEAAPNPSEGEK